jgi:hypothetical protein
MIRHSTPPHNSCAAQWTMANPVSSSFVQGMPTSVDLPGIGTFFTAGKEKGLSISA